MATTSPLFSGLSIEVSNSRPTASRTRAKSALYLQLEPAVLATLGTEDSITFSVTEDEVAGIRSTLNRIGRLNEAKVSVRVAVAGDGTAKVTAWAENVTAVTDAPAEPEAPAKPARAGRK